VQKSKFLGFLLDLRKNPTSPHPISPAANCFSSVNVAKAMLPSDKTIFAWGDVAWVRAILRKSSLGSVLESTVSKKPGQNLFFSHRKTKSPKMRVIGKNVELFCAKIQIRDVYFKCSLTPMLSLLHCFIASLNRIPAWRTMLKVPPLHQ
jgi:hypothetical protein